MNMRLHYQEYRKKPYVARWSEGEKTRNRFFATESERAKFIREFEKHATRQDDSLPALEPRKLARWQEASKLAPDADPVEVMRYWLASRRPSLTETKLDHAIAAYLRHLESMERDHSYRKHVEAQLNDMRANLGNRPVHEFDHQALADYILSKPYKPVTKRHYKRTISGAFAWWQEQNWCMDNPAVKIRTPDVVAKEPGILSPEETEALFHHSEKIDPEVCGLLALGAFAGMRTSAISKVAYEEIDFQQRGILTPAEKTKTKRRNWVEDLPDNLWAWLKRTPPEAFQMTHRHFLHRRSEAYKRAGLIIEADDIAYENAKRARNGEPPVKWKPKSPPKNALRHSFVTYHVALHRNPGKTALIVSHTDQDILYRHYLGIATKDAASVYFNIFPRK